MYFVNKGWMLLCDGDGVIDMWIANYIGVLLFVCIDCIDCIDYYNLSFCINYLLTIIIN